MVRPRAPGTKLQLARQPSDDWSTHLSNSHILAKPSGSALPGCCLEGYAVSSHESKSTNRCGRQRQQRALTGCKLDCWICSYACVLHARILGPCGTPVYAVQLATGV